MRTFLILLTIAASLPASGCVGVSDYARVQGELSATRDENTRLRDENFELHRELARTTSKLDMIDMILHDQGPEGPGRPAPAGSR